MTNIVKKIKNVNSLALFTKLVGLAVMFSVVSCGCGKNNNKVTAAGEIKNNKVELTISTKDPKKVDDIKIKLVEIKAEKDGKQVDAAATPGLKNFNVGEEKDLKNLTDKKDITEKVPVVLTFDFADEKKINEGEMDKVTVRFEIIEGKETVEVVVEWPTKK
ncbi:MAG: hypothetical protein ACYC2U_02100 [Candidatus Amoebophilus sp.]